MGEICAESSEGRYLLFAILKTLPVKVVFVLNTEIYLCNVNEWIYHNHDYCGRFLCMEKMCSKAR